MYLRMPGFRQTGPGARAAHLELELLYLTASSRFNMCVTLFFLSYIDILLPILYCCKPENRASAKNITYSGSHSQQVAEPASSPHLSSPPPPHSPLTIYLCSASPLCLTLNALKIGSGLMHTFHLPKPTSHTEESQARGHRVWNRIGQMLPVRHWQTT